MLYCGITVPSGGKMGQRQIVNFVRRSLKRIQIMLKHEMSHLSSLHYIFFKVKAQFMKVRFSVLFVDSVKIH